MMFVTTLPYGWELYAVPASEELGGIVPGFVKDRRRGRVFRAGEMAVQSGARQIFHELKRKLDIADITWKNPGDDPRFKAMDKAKFAMQLAMKRVGVWSDDLLETGVTVDG